MRRKTLQLPLDLYRSLVKPKIGRRCENSDRLYKQANDFFQRADKNYCRDMYQSGTGHDEARNCQVTRPLDHAGDAPVRFVRSKKFVGNISLIKVNMHSPTLA